MGNREQLAAGEFYHIYNRGVDKRDIFLDISDKKRFLALLYMANTSEPVDLKLQGSTLEEIYSQKRDDTLVDICAYCLMPNHFHILIHEHADELGGTSKFMQKLGTAYTMYFNKKYGRAGSLFQGRYKSKHVDNDEYLQYLLGYIHLNPIKLIEPSWKKTGIEDRRSAEKYLNEYAYSSYIDYTEGARPIGRILNKECYPAYFEKPQGFAQHTRMWLNFKPLQG